MECEKPKQTRQSKLAAQDEELLENWPRNDPEGSERKGYGTQEV